MTCRSPLQLACRSPCRCRGTVAVGMIVCRERTGASSGFFRDVFKAHSSSPTLSFWPECWGASTLCRPSCTRQLITNLNFERVNPSSAVGASAGLQTARRCRLVAVARISLFLRHKHSISGSFFPPLRILAARMTFEQRSATFSRQMVAHVLDSTLLSRSAAPPPQSWA